MSYWIGVGLVALLQAAVSLLTIAASTGNGSFVGLGAMLMAVVGIPVTALVNFLLVRDHRRNPAASRVATVVKVSSALPVLQLALLIAQKAFNL